MNILRPSLFLLLVVGIIFLSQTDPAESQWGGIIRGAVNMGRKIGGSGKAMRHFRNMPNRKAAENAARNAGKGNTPVQHSAHKPGQKPHFHPADRNGNIVKDGSHFNYPKQQG